MFYNTCKQHNVSAARLKTEYIIRMIISDKTCEFIKDFHCMVHCHKPVVMGDHAGSKCVTYVTSATSGLCKNSCRVVTVTFKTPD